ncbi:hypothetical protein M0805_003800 [Coniferiporia weirii]|nr:hypothetical protein M0805_003800 [Coniferiporia weirii]
MAQPQAHDHAPSSAKKCFAITQTPLTRQFRYKTPRLCNRLLVASTLLYLSSLAIGQAFQSNGQFFTRGLAISDAPAPGSTQHAGSSLVIAIDLSGDGKIAQTSFIPGSSASTRYDSLELYLVSSQTRSNFTVSNNTTLLTQEPGSTVKHLNWPIPPCVAPGVYNLTFYESAHINNEAFFSITSLNVTVDNANESSDSSQCNDISNQLQIQPQADTAPSINPYLDPNSGVTIPSLSGGSAAHTITLGESGFPTQWTIEPSGSSVTSATEPITTVTLVVISSTTQTETVATGSNQIVTTTLVGFFAPAIVRVSTILTNSFTHTAIQLQLL